jgi:hypothetical protein
MTSETLRIGNSVLQTSELSANRYVWSVALLQAKNAIGR